MPLLLIHHHVSAPASARTSTSASFFTSLAEALLVLYRPVSLVVSGNYRLSLGLYILIYTRGLFVGPCI